MDSWNKYTEEYLSKITSSIRRKRVLMFIDMLRLGENDKILDLGSEDGSYLARYYPYAKNIFLADMIEEPMKLGVTLYGLGGYYIIPENGNLPFRSQEFDVIWCNSVIEHVTLNLNQLSSITGQDFKRRANEHQKSFAKEIERVGKKYFVQTPYLHFPIEAHSWLPLVQYLPQPQRWNLSRKIKKVWLKQWSADYYLYNITRFREHFPYATHFYTEKILGIPKSLIAIRTR
jgi:SAM-dependent methyltransferase